MLNKIEKNKKFFQYNFFPKNRRKLKLTIFPKNCKGGEKLLSIWWFFVLAIVGVGVSASVLIYHSAEADVREIETNILYERIINCVAEQGFLIEGLIGEDFDIFNKCQLNKEIKEGDFSFEKDCEIQEGEEGVSAKYYPKCIRKKEIILYYVDNKIEEVELEILTASNQVGRKVSVIK